MIVGSKQDGIAVTDLVAGKDGKAGVRLIPRLLTDGRYALPDAAKTDPEYAAAHAILANWATETPSNYAPAPSVGVYTLSRLHILERGQYYYQTGGRGNVLTMPAEGVYRTRIGQFDGLLTDQADNGRRRSELAALEFASTAPGPAAGQTVWASFCFVLAGVPSYRAGVPVVIHQYHSTGVAGAPSLGVNFYDGKLMFVTRSSADTNPTTGNGKPVYHWEGPMPEDGVKTHIVLQATFGQTGHLNVWLNGIQVVNADTPIGYYASNAAGKSLGVPQIGQYSAASEFEDIMYIANPEWILESQGTLADRITNPLPVPDLNWT